MAKKRKKKTSQPPVFSPKKYIKDQGRKLPIGPCYASRDTLGPESEKGLFQTIITRAKPSGKYLVGLYLIDAWCLGLKSTHVYPNMDAEELDALLAQVSSSEDSPLVEVSYQWAHSLIYGGIAYAKGFGFRPDKDFAITRYMLEPAHGDIPMLSLEYGRNGKPYLIAGPYDNGPRLLAILRETAGDGNFDFLLPIGGSAYEEDW